MTKQYNQRRAKPGNSNGGRRPAQSHKKFHPLSSVIKPKHSFETIRTNFLDHLSVLSSTVKNMNDMVKSIEDRVLITLKEPTVKVSQDPDPSMKAAEDKAYLSDYTAQSKIYHSRKEDLRQNQPFVRGLIMTKFVTTEMEDKIRNEVDFDSELQNPVKLMNRIEKFMKESHDGSYDVWNHFQQQQKLFNMRQFQDESAMNWKKRFERQGEIVKEQAGDDLFKEFVTKTKAYQNLAGTSTTEHQEMEDQAYEIVMSTGLLCNSDRKRTEELIKELREQYARGNDQYPRTLEGAYNMIHVHISTNTRTETRPGANLQQQGGTKGPKKKERSCFVCGKKDCLAPKCPRRWDPKEKWSNPDRYKVYPANTGTTLTQQGSTTPSTADGGIPRQLTVPSQQGSVGTQLMQVPAGTRLMQVDTQDGGSILVPYFGGENHSQQGTLRASNLTGTRPFVRRGAGFAHIGVPVTRDKKQKASNTRNKNKDEHMIVRRQGNQFILLGSVSKHHAWNIDINSIEEQEDPDYWAEYYAAQDEEVPDLNNQPMMGVQHLFNERRDDPFGLYERTLMDSGATHTTVCNPNMVQDIREAQYPLDMSTNVGERMIEHDARLGRYPSRVYFDENGKANVLAMSEMINLGYRVTFDSDTDNAFIVHCGGGRQMRFVHRKGVYVFEHPNDAHDPDGSEWTSLVARGNEPLTNRQPFFNVYQGRTGYSAMETAMPTVRKNKEGFTRTQVKKAMDARSAMHIVGAPTERRLKEALRAGLFKNCDITEQAIDHAAAIYGKDTSTLKGKSTRLTPKKSVNDWIDIPRELTLYNHTVEICVDHMFVNNAIFLTCIDTTVMFRQCKAVQNTAKDTMFSGIDKFLRKYNKGGFKVSVIHCDNEFIPITDDMMDEMNVTVEPTPPGGHQPHSERNNRTIKERMRVSHARMPFSAIPRIMTEALGESVTEKLNYFPAKNGISKHYSTEQIVEHRNVNFKRNCVAEFGAYVHGTGGESSNTMVPRAIEAIYLRPTRTTIGGHRLLNLNTKKIITRNKVTNLPLTDQVIARINSWAHEEGIHSLKFFDKKGNQETYQDGDQIAGVDDNQQGYAEEAFDPDYEENQDEDDTYDVNLQGRFDDIEQDEDVDLIMDAIDNVYDDHETEQLFDDEFPRFRQDVRDEDYDPDSDPPIGQVEEEIPINIEDMETELEDLAIELDEMQEEEIVFEPEAETPASSPRRTRSGATYAQVVKGLGLSHSSIPRESHSHRSAVKKKRNGRTYTRKKKRMKELKTRINRAIREKKLSRSNLERRKEAIHNLQFQQIGNDKHFDYTDEEAVLIARCMMQIKDKFQTNNGLQFIQQFYLNKGLKIFGDRGVAGVDKELKQLLKRQCFRPELVKNLSQRQLARAQEAMMLLAEKDITKEVKGRLVFRGDGTREWLSREDTASPTASLEGIELTLTVDAYEQRDMMSMDVPNAFIQTFMPEPKKDDGEEEVVMKITGALVNILIDLDPEMRKYVVKENGKRVIYTVVLRAIYGMLQSSLLWYNQFRGDLEEKGFIFNEYDPCIANKIVNGKQQTIRFHVDDLLSSHVDPKVNDEFALWLNARYGKIKPCTIVRGKKHRYLGMLLDFSYKGKVKIRMDEYTQKMNDEFPIKFGDDVTQETPAGNDLLDAGRGALLDDERREIFHSFVAKGIFLSKRARLDIHPTVSVLATRVRKPNESDWKKLTRMMRYLHATKKWHKTLRADSLRVIKHYVDASFAVHPDFRSHTGSTMTMGNGAMLVKSSKQKLNSRSSTEAELIGVDDAITMILWTKLFMEQQGYEIDENIIYQDNKSAILLEKNGRKSAGKRSRAINIRYFFVTDHVEKGNVSIEYCPTDDMIADFMTKPLQGQKFRDFRSDILGDQD